MIIILHLYGGIIMKLTKTLSLIALFSVISGTTYAQTTFYNAQGQSYHEVYGNYNSGVVSQSSTYQMPESQRVSGTISIGVGVGAPNAYYAPPVQYYSPPPVYTYTPPVQPQYYAPPVYQSYQTYPAVSYGVPQTNYVNPLPWIALGGLTTALIYDSNRHHYNRNYNYNYRPQYRPSHGHWRR